MQRREPDNADEMGASLKGSASQPIGLITSSGTLIEHMGLRVPEHGMRLAPDYNPFHGHLKEARRQSFYDKVRATCRLWRS